MAFIRIKKIKKYEYAYLVENTWKKKTSRQKVKEYLGRVVKLDEEKVEFPGTVSELSFEDSVKKILKWQLTRYGFICDDSGCKSDTYEYNEKTHEIKTIKHGKPVVIKSYDGYINKYSIKKLLAFDPVGTEEEIAWDLAKVFVDCGLFVPKEVFIDTFQKVYDVKKAMHR